MTVPPSHGRGT